jgi:hypothetical protein
MMMAVPFMPFFAKARNQTASGGSRLLFHELRNVPEPLTEAGALAIFDPAFYNWADDGIRDAAGNRNRRLRTLLEETGIVEVPGDAGKGGQRRVSAQVIVVVNHDLLRRDRYDNGCHGARALVRGLTSLIGKEFEGRLWEEEQGVRVCLATHDRPAGTVLLKLGHAARLPGNEAPQRSVSLTLRNTDGTTRVLSTPTLFDVTETDGLLDLAERAVAIYPNTRHLMFAAQEQSGITVLPDLTTFPDTQSVSVDVRRRRGLMQGSHGLYTEVFPQILPSGEEIYQFEVGTGLSDDPTAGPAGLTIHVSAPLTRPDAVPAKVGPAPLVSVPEAPSKPAVHAASQLMQRISERPRRSTASTSVEEEHTIIVNGSRRSTLGLAVTAIALPRLAPDNGLIERWTLRFDKHGQVVRRADVSPQTCLQLCTTAARPDSLFLAMPGASRWEIVSAPRELSGGLRLSPPPTGLEDRYHGLIPLQEQPVLTLPPGGGILGRAGQGDTGRLVVGLLTQPGSLILAIPHKGEDESFMERMALSRQHLNLRVVDGRVEVSTAQGATPAWHLLCGDSIVVSATLPEAGSGGAGTTLSINEGQALLVGPYMFTCRSI